MNIIISADSTIDLSQELLNKYDIKTIGLSISLGNKEYIDGENITTKDIYHYISKTNTLPKTSAVNVERYREFFAKYSNTDTAIIHFTISSEMSSCYNFAKTASKDFENIYIIDSRSLSTGIGVLAIYARCLAQENRTIEEIVSLLEQKANSNKNNVSFIIDDLKLLHKGGRCSAVQRFGANLLRIKVCIGVKDGVMGVDRKYKGKFEQTITQYIDDTLNSHKDFDKHCCFITYTTASQEVLDNAKNAIEKFGIFENIYYTQAGSTITCHCGENTIGIAFLLN